MAKPSLAAARWADLGTNNTAPSSGQRNTGWTPNQVAVSSYFNALALAYYNWFQWIDAGVWEAASLVLTGNLAVGGTVAVTGTSTFTGIATFNNTVAIGTQKLTHGDKIRPFGTDLVDLVGSSGGAVSAATLGDGGSSVAAGALGYYRMPVVDAHQRLKGFSITGTGTGSSAQLLRYNISNATYAPVAVTGGTGTGNSFVGIAGGTWDLVPTTPATNSAGYIYIVKITAAGGATANPRMGLMTYDAV